MSAAAAEARPEVWSFPRFVPHFVRPDSLAMVREDVAIPLAMITDDCVVSRAVAIDDNLTIRGANTIPADAQLANGMSKSSRPSWSSDCYGTTP